MTIEGDSTQFTPPTPSAEELARLGGDQPAEPGPADSAVQTEVPGSGDAAAGYVAPVPEMAASDMEAGPQVYTVVEGDTLSAIAERFYGDANQYMRIFEANTDKLSNPDLIQPGQELVIPT